MIDKVFVFFKRFYQKNGNSSKLWIIVLLTGVLMFSMIILENKVSTNVILAVIYNKKLKIYKSYNQFKDY